MSDAYGYGNFSDQTDVTGVVDGTAKTEITANITNIKLLFGVITGNPPGLQGQKPDFDEIHPETRVKLLAELDSLDAAVNAAPEA